VFNEVEEEEACAGGEVAPNQAFLAKVDPSKCGVAVCTISGQQFAYGDASDEFAVQAAGRPILYCIAQSLCGVEEVHEHVGMEPGPHAYNAIVVNDQNKPYNPFYSAGALVNHSMIKPNGTETQRFEAVFEFWKRCAGGTDKGVAFNNSCFLSEMDASDRNYAVAYMLKESVAFPAQKGENAEAFNQEEIDKLLRLSSMEQSIAIDCEKMSIVASTLANGGTCPVTGEQIFDEIVVRNCLSIMSSSGVQRKSGEFAFEMGFPAAVGISGIIMVIIPKVMGMCFYAPKVEQLVSVKAQAICKKLSERFNFHRFGNLPGISETTGVKDPTLHNGSNDTVQISLLAEHASNGDLFGVMNLINMGVDPTLGDYDQRTALHLACAEGHINIVKYLVETGFSTTSLSRTKSQLDLQETLTFINARDRWQGTPLSDALRGGFQDLAAYMVSKGAME